LNDLHCVFYLDKKIPKPDELSAWQRLLDDVSTGKFDAVMTWLSVPDMQQFCEGYNTRFVELDIFGWFQAMRAAKDDILRIDIRQGK